MKSRTDIIEPFEQGKHRSLVHGWLSARRIALPDDYSFSEIGFVVNEIACGFLFVCGRRAYIDDIAASGLDPVIDRDRAIRIVIRSLVQAAKERAINFVQVLAQLPTMRQRLMDSGFRPAGDYTLFWIQPGGSKCLGQFP